MIFGAWLMGLEGKALETAMEGNIWGFMIIRVWNPAAARSRHTIECSRGGSNLLSPKKTGKSTVCIRDQVKLIRNFTSHFEGWALTPSVGTMQVDFTV